MYDIFLSYRRKDAMGNSNVATARTFKLEFERRGMKVFFDYSECTDDYFSDKILPAIRTCRYFVLVLTKDCLDRCKNEGDWLLREITEAIKFGRKIVPISPDGVFEGWPKDLPEAIGQLSAGDGLQITTIHMDRVFESNVELLINDRMGGMMKRETERWNSGAGTYLKVTCNMDCVMYIDGEEYGTLSAGRLQKIPLAEGEYMLEFESVEYRSDRINAAFEMPNKDKLYNVDLLAKKEERKERDRREREERGRFNVGGVEFKMVYVEGGTFTMGVTSELCIDALGDEKLAHKVKLSDYYIGETEVTQVLWKTVMGDNPSSFKGDDNLPVEEVSWEDIVEKFIPALNRKTGRTFRLPTEAEWEYAARGGNKSKGYMYSGSNNIDEVAWYDGNSGGKTHPVKRKRANELGLYDMSGNVWEWCIDWYGHYSSGAQINPQGPNKGFCRVLRGGSWGNFARNCRVSLRFNYAPDRRFHCNGFRLVLCP